MRVPVSIVAAALAASPAAHAAEFAVPVLLESPPCAVERLRSVSVELGQKVNESTQDTRVPTVRLAAALEQLARAAQQEGANAVVLRSRQGVYFTRNGRQSTAPVYIRLQGGAVRLPEDTAACRLVHVDADAMEREMRGRRPSQATARNAYGD